MAVIGAWYAACKPWSAGLTKQLGMPSRVKQNQANQVTWLTWPGSIPNVHQCMHTNT